MVANVGYYRIRIIGSGKKVVNVQLLQVYVTCCLLTVVFYREFVEVCEAISGRISNKGG